MLMETLFSGASCSSGVWKMAACRFSASGEVPRAYFGKKTLLVSIFPGRTFTGSSDSSKMYFTGRSSA